MITTRLTDYYYNLLHDIKAAKGRFSCFITHACKQLFIDVLWTWHEKEDITKHHENYRTSKSRVAETQMRLESPLERRRECLYYLLMRIFEIPKL